MNCLCGSVVPLSSKLRWWLCLTRLATGWPGGLRPDPAGHWPEPAGQWSLRVQVSARDLR